MVGQNSEKVGFVAVKPKVAIINYDDSSFSKGLVDYLKDNTKVVDIDSSEAIIKEAIYFQTVSFVYEIPKNFGNDFFAGYRPIISTYSVQGSDAIQAGMLSENYLRLAKPLIVAGMNQSDVVVYLKDNHSTSKTTVEINSQKVNSEFWRVQYFYNFVSYVFLALCIMIVSALMIIFYSQKIKRRNYISPVSYSSITKQLFLGNLIYVIGIWLLFVGLSFVLYPKMMLTINGLLYVASSLVFCVFALSIGFMVGSLIKNKNAVSGITNVVALGSSFLCGVFMPQELLGESVIKVAKFFPTYWYVKSNEIIAGLSEYSFESLKPVVDNMLIVFSFAVAIFVITFLVGLLRRKE